MKEQSFWIDGKQIIDDGDIVGPPILADAVSRLEPLYS